MKDAIHTGLCPRCHEPVTGIFTELVTCSCGLALRSYAKGEFTVAFPTPSPMAKLFDEIHAAGLDDTGPITDE